MTLVSGLAQMIGSDDPLQRGSVPGLSYQLDADGNVFEGYLPSTPNKLVAVLPSGGYEADALLPYDRPTIQFIVRGDDDPVWALDTWQALYDAVASLRNMELPDGTYLVSLQAVQSGPIHIGPDNNGRYQYGLNVECEIRNPTVERPG